MSNSNVKPIPEGMHTVTPIDDVDAFAKRAVDAGAKITMPVADAFWGDRYGQMEDPFGHRWSIATHTREVSPEEMQRAMENMGNK